MQGGRLFVATLGPATSPAINNPTRTTAAHKLAAIKVKNARFGRAFRISSSWLTTPRRGKGCLGVFTQRVTADRKLFLGNDFPIPELFRGKAAAVPGLSLSKTDHNSIFGAASWCGPPTVDTEACDDNPAPEACRVRRRQRTEACSGVPAAGIRLYSAVSRYPGP
jgi:hypothetical protein